MKTRTDWENLLFRVWLIRRGPVVLTPAQGAELDQIEAAIRDQLLDSEAV